MHDTDIFTICADQADFGGTDLVIDARAGVALRRRVVGSAGYGNIPLLLPEIRGRKVNRPAPRFKRHRRADP